MRRIVIGIGNEYRTDDGLGVAVVAELARRSLPDVELIISDGEPTQLLAAWDAAELAVVVDAVLCEPSAPGTVHRASAAGQLTESVASSHSLGIPEAVRLGDALGRRPARLVVYAVEAADLGFGRGLSSSVAAAVERVADAVVADLAACG